MLILAGGGAKTPPLAARPEEVPVTSLTYSNIETRVDRPKSEVNPCQPSFGWIKFWHTQNPLPQSIQLRLGVLVRYWAGQGE